LDPLHVAQFQFLDNLSQAAKATSESTSRVVGSKLMDAEEALIPFLPPISALKRRVQRNRKRTCGNLKPPTSLDDLNIPDELKLSSHGKCFILYDSKEATRLYTNRTIIFGSEESVNWLNTSSAIFADGTFNAAPPMFAQLYTIIGLRNSNAFPCLYALLSGKTQSVYDSLIKEVNKLCPNLKPTSILTDFEKASSNAFSANFKTSKFLGCFFQFKQATMRRFQNNNAIWKLYKSD